MTSECVFCKIVAGKLPCSLIYEDDYIISFLDISPVVPGHVLVLPKAHHDNITVTPDDLLARCMQFVRKVATVQKRTLHADGVNVTQANGASAGQSVPHLHIHVIPRYADTHQNWEPGEYNSPEDMAHMTHTIREALND